jgi:hypothetical protein
MIDDEVETALIVEEDLDFAIDIRKQLLRLRPALSEIQGLNNGSRSDRKRDRKGVERALPGDWEML